MNILLALFIIGWILLFIILFGPSSCPHKHVLIKKELISKKPIQYIITHRCSKCNRIIKKYKTNE